MSLIGKIVSKFTEPKEVDKLSMVLKMGGFEDWKSKRNAKALLKHYKKLNRKEKKAFDELVSFKFGNLE